jgi:FtsX-like permease family
VGLIGFLAATRVSRASAASAASRVRRPHRTIAEMAAKIGLRPSATNGLRMAFEPGHGASAVPVRSAFFGAMFGVVGLTAVLVFATSLGHLGSSPRLYGWTWDFKAPDNTFTTDCGAADYRLSEVPGVAAVTAVCYQLGVQINGRPTTGWGFTPVHGSIDPEIVTGRASSGPSEVALGAATLHALHKKIGDTVQVRGAKATHDYRIVGQVVLPQLQDGEIQPLSDGAAFTGEGFSPLADQSGHTRYLIGTFTPGVDRAAVVRRIDRIAQFQAPADQGSFVSERGASGPTRPPEIGRLREINWFPPTLAILVAVLALVAVGHALVTTAHRRRSELALLKTLGFERAQVRATLAWQATTLAIVGLAVGVPVGVLAGNLVWRHVADSLGTTSVASFPVVALAITVPCVIALVNAVGFWPARKAARTWPADALAAE